MRAAHKETGKGLYMVGNSQMSIFQSFLRFVNIIFLQNVMAVLVHGGLIEREYETLTGTQVSKPISNREAERLVLAAYINLIETNGV